MKEKRCEQSKRGLNDRGQVVAEGDQSPMVQPNILFVIVLPKEAVDAIKIVSMTSNQRSLNLFRTLSAHSLGHGKKKFGTKS